MLRRVRGTLILLSIAFFVALFFLQPLVTQAQEDASEIVLGAAPQAALAGTVSCFDYYAFGSVQAKLTSSVASTVSGAIMTFNGTLENANPYPIVDGALYVKVFKTRGTTNDGNGPDVVDQFFVQDGISIPANGSVPVSLEWRVPSYAQSGEYKLATFFTTSRKFNLLGLSFTDDVVGNTVPFRVVGEQTSSVAFDKAGVTVNGSEYHFAAFPPRVSGGPATVQGIVRNTTNTPQTVTVLWSVYQWDAQQDENMVQREERSVIVPARGSAPVSITVQDAQYPVYLTVGTLSWHDSKSIVGVRFVREGVDRPRINFPSITSFPLKANEETTLFSCLHNTGESIVAGDTLTLTLSDMRGKVIHEYQYQGDITGAMMGVAEKFTPKKMYDYFTLDAKLASGETVIDSVRVTYDCAKIDPAQCAVQSSNWLYYFIGGVLALLVLTWLLRKLRRKERNIPPPIGAQY